MFSGIFIDRPRFAVVIAIVITLAGAIAIRAISPPSVATPPW